MTNPIDKALDHPILAALIAFTLALGIGCAAMAAVRGQQGRPDAGGAATSQTPTTPEGGTPPSGAVGGTLPDSWNDSPTLRTPDRAVPTEGISEEEREEMVSALEGWRDSEGLPRDTEFVSATGVVTEDGGRGIGFEVVGENRIVYLSYDGGWKVSGTGVAREGTLMTGEVTFFEASRLEQLLGRQCAESVAGAWDEYALPKGLCGAEDAFVDAGSVAVGETRVTFVVSSVTYAGGDYLRRDVKVTYDTVDGSFAFEPVNRERE